MTRSNATDLRQLSKRLSWALRHGCGELGLLCDPEGFVAIEDLIEALRAQDDRMCMEHIVQVVALAPEKQRFALRDGWIRANYGHSLPNRIKHTRQTPPALLFHGTALAALAAIEIDGLRPMNRQYVHLCNDPNLAKEIGARHGRPVLLRVNAEQAHQAQLNFYCANERFWLADHVPPGYLQVIDRIDR